MLVQANAYVSILDRAPPPSVIEGDQVRFFQTDITLVGAIEKAVEETVAWTKETGNPAGPTIREGIYSHEDIDFALGGVINCAGVGAGAKIIDAQNEPHSLELFEFVLAVNLTGSFNLTRLALKHMVHNKPEEGVDGERGVIVLVSSSAAVSCLLNRKLLIVRHSV